MDYEKAYKAVLKTAIQWIKDGCTDKEKICLECVFPELRESEDERIRKWIIEELEITRDAMSGKNPYSDDPDIVARLKRLDEAIDHLEKQKELPFVKDVILGYPGLYFYDGERMHFRGSTAMEEKHKEQNPAEDKYQQELEATDRWQEGYEAGYNAASKPAEWSEGDKLCVSVLESFVASFIDSIPNLEQSYRSNVKKGLQLIQSIRLQPKPEWSEEDKQWLSEVYFAIDHSMYSEVEMQAMKKYIDYLRYQFQPKQEWSGEDEKMLTGIIERGSVQVPPYTTALREEQIEWLMNRFKSLHPQSHKEIYQAAKHDIALKFMNYLDENRPEGKMSLSNGECEDIDKAFKENDWAKILRYANKYSWKPRKEHVDAVRYFVNKHQSEAWAATGQWKEFTALRGLLDILQKLM